jgi:hypothetical protein
VTLIGILPSLGEGEWAAIHVLYSDRSLKWLAAFMVSAEMVNRKLLSTQAAGIKHLYFTLYSDGNQQRPAMAELYPELCGLERSQMPLPGGRISTT